MRFLRFLLPPLIVASAARADFAADRERFIETHCKNSAEQFCVEHRAQRLTRKLQTRRVMSPTRAPPTPLRRADAGGPPPPRLAVINRILVRADYEDTFYQGVTGEVGLTGQASQAKGASVSFGGNLHSVNSNGAVSHPLNATTQAFGSFNLLDLPIIYRPIQTAVMPSLFVQTDGTWDQPSKASDDSYIRAGPNINFGYYTNSTTLEAVYASVNAYYQTDYFGTAKIHGTAVTMSPYAPAIDLGGTETTNPYVTAYVVARPEFDFMSVDNPGHTLLFAHDYVWAGASLRGYAFPFQTLPGQSNILPGSIATLLADKISLIAAFDVFSDLRSNSVAKSYSFSLQYTLSGCKTNQGSAPSAASPCPNEGSSSIAFEYDAGEEREMFAYQRKYSVRLSYKY